MARGKRPDRLSVRRRAERLLTSETRKLCARRALLAADWFVRTQVVHRWPAWNANNGRFIYNHHIPSGRTMLTLEWNTGRAVMCCLAAYERTKERKYLDAAVRGGEYLKSLQVLDARDDDLGAFREETPQSDFCAPRDGVEAASAFMLLYRVTKAAEYLRRAELYARWHVKVGMNGGAEWPAGYVYFDGRRVVMGRRGFGPGAGAGHFFSYLHRVTGKRRPLDVLRFLADGVIRRFQRADGALMVGFKDKLHGGEGRNAGVAFNDDGVGVTLLCAHRLTGKRKYLDAAVRAGEWLLSFRDEWPGFAALPSAMLFLADLARATGSDRYLKYVLPRLEKVLDLQVTRRDNPTICGAFRGEDEDPAEFVPGGRGRDYVETRVTAYATLALFKLEGKVFGPYYSAFGW
jgi:hypothetical protein